jgi:hypothetical protein
VRASDGFLMRNSTYRVRHDGAVNTTDASSSARDDSITVRLPLGPPSLTPEAARALLALLLRTYNERFSSTGEEPNAVLLDRRDDSR